MLARHFRWQPVERDLRIVGMTMLAKDGSDTVRLILQTDGSHNSQANRKSKTGATAARSFDALDDGGHLHGGR